MTKPYDELFEVRGKSYDRAMSLCPDARRKEFEQVIFEAKLSAGMVVADVPAGGGYLKRYLPAQCVWLGHEPCSTFSRHGSKLHASTLLPLPWNDNSVDVAISLAGVHHTAEKLPLFREFYRVVRQGGRLIISDVASGSAVAAFLDGYVGDHNSTGHEGNFLDLKTLNELCAAGWKIDATMMPEFEWVFANSEEMGQFCQQLFDIQSATVAETLNAIESCLGITYKGNGGVGMFWSLMTIVATKQ